MTPGLAFFVYQEMFAVITPALITGAFADRVNFKSYLKFLILWSILIYIPVANWIWGGGFLSTLGVVDFAGGIVVLATAGIAALASVFFLGKRRILPGESTAPNNIAFVNTDIAGSVEMIVWLIITWIREKNPR